MKHEDSINHGVGQAWDLPFPFLESLEASLRPMEKQMAVLDKDLAPLLGLSLPSLRATISRNRERIPEGEVFRSELGHGATWALTELGALIITSWVRTPEASEAHVRLIRGLHQKNTSPKPMVALEQSWMP